MADLLGILRIKDSNGNWVSVPGLKGDTGEPFKILGIFATAADLEAAVTDPGVGDVYLVGTTGAYDIYLYLADGWHNTGRYMPKGDQGDPAPQSAITSAVETWLAANVDPETGYVLDRTLSLETAAAPADLVGVMNSKLSDFVTQETVNGDLCILVPYNALSVASIESVGDSITRIKSIGKNLYPYGRIPRYEYSFYISSLATAKSKGIRLPKGSYTLTFTSSVEANRIMFRAWSDDGTLLSDGSASFSVLYVNETNYLTRDFYWQTYRYTTAQRATTNVIVITVKDNPVWFLFCEDSAADYGDISNAQLEVGYNNPTSYEAYSETSYDATAKSVSVVPNGMIVFTASDTTDTASSVTFGFKKETDFTKLVAKPFDTTESGYEKGDYCIQEGKLFECNTTQEQGSVFNPNNWTEICVMDEISDLNETQSQLKRNTKNPFLMPFMQNGRPKLVAHTGYSANGEPENTIPAYIAAGEAGFWAIESDVQKTSDGYFVMMHDTTLDRTTNGTGLISDKTLAEIRELHIKDHDDLQVPTLEEYLAICKMYGCTPVIEIKSTVAVEDFPNLIEAVRKFGLENNCMFSGSPYLNVGNFQSLTNAPLALIYQAAGSLDIPSTINNLIDVYHVKNIGVHVEGITTISKDLIAKLHENNIFAFCFVLDTYEAVQQAFEYGYDAVTTNTVVLPQ